MRVVIQRVTHASVTVDNKVAGAIQHGLMVLVGVEDSDTEQDVEWLAGKVCSLRIFNDQNGVMNLSVKEIGGEILVISQFTLFAATKKGNRPSYIRASKPPVAVPMFEMFKSAVSANLGRKVESGIFGADMKCELLNDGPVTIVMDSHDRDNF